MLGLKLDHVSKMGPKWLYGQGDPSKYYCILRDDIARNYLKNMQFFLCFRFLFTLNDLIIFYTIYSIGSLVHICIISIANSLQIM